ncbi:MAG: cyclopropane-fatty-acyl-phospholipid synthase family protein [Hyphomicrobium sp.]|uniref:SAM-dependent methyltransferase n=1 Tax=Hyphomicrobium sp. TaxID=82 RepID=UPI001328FF24|nr:cyclopropane-fatty-acyl-phospholipid synthase family protein [Hyphomicrobium sp.]KAB2943550.1 MAG: class I SAM-dependent methyltransferase [Hyphomicrobium sp.]MBZ0209732.1 cyclopropane-fatty-acyl-phospholipid synthase family protein [Hyphomicrobium sp.]
MARLLRAFLKQVVQHGTLEVETATGARFVVGDGTGSPLAIRFADNRAARQLVLNPALAFGELFMERRLAVTQGSIYDVLSLAASNLKLREPHPIAKARTRLRTTFRRLQQHNSAWRARRNVAHHYDLDGRLYDLFLDPDRQYSCAYFERPDQSLAEAQLAKKRHIAAKLLIEPGQRVLDIGCGWGGLALYLADYCGADVTGVTLSEEQLGIANARARERGVASSARFRLQDYRAVSESFDRIVSVGMFEHVGVGYYGAFFNKAADLLADDGVMLLHSIGCVDGPGACNPWIAKYIFPGGYVPALSEVLPAIERAGLVVTDIEILRLHYAETLRAWRERFLARRGEAKLLYDERFCRMWEFYLAACECAFRHCGLMVFQIQLAKRQDAVPLTRDYLAEREAALKAKEGCEASLKIAAE